MKLPQLSLRDLFCLVLVCAVAVGWWVDHRRAGKRIEELELDPLSKYRLVFPNGYR